jgi:hypothetical protein
MSTHITNKYNLPQTLYDAIKYDSHKVAGDISVSQLIDSPQIRLLRKSHDVEEDVVDRLWALLGTAVHNVLERANISDYKRRAFMVVAEELEAIGKQGDNQKVINAAKFIRIMMDEFFPELKQRYMYEQTLWWKIGEETLYGTLDLYEKATKTLFDYKVTSVYKYLYPESRRAWDIQTNTYAWLLRKNGFEVDHIKIVAIFRDHTKPKYSVSGDYPQEKILEIPIQVVAQDRMTKYVESRMRLHEIAFKEGKSACSGHERWAEADAYAIMAANNPTRALRVLDSAEAAEAEMKSRQHKHQTTTLYIEKRLGQNKRCEKYCNVAHVCPQYAAYLKNNPSTQTPVEE